MVNADLFARLVPLNSLLHSDRGTLAKQSSVLTYRAGQVAFTRGELARTQAYLLSGDIELQTDSASSILRAGGEESRHPLAPGNKRSATALCLKPCEILFADRDLLDLLLTWSQTGVQKSAEEALRAVESDDDHHDWMTALLQSKAFLRVPPGNIAQIFASMEAVSFSPGQIIIQQGAPGDYYYVVTEGRVQVVLRDKDGNNEEELAQLGVGKSFGEESLVSGRPRNASVRALTRCTLMRLSSTAFMRLLRAPLLQEVQLAELGTQQLLDVRLPDEFQHGHLAGAINLPLAQLRDGTKSLNSAVEYWVYCDTGRRSASAAYLLNERGFIAKLVKGGAAPESLVAID